MKKVICALFFVIPMLGYGQLPDFAVQDYHPSTPSSFQFDKYTELPVSEFTGVANISVPIYTVKEDGLSFPVALSYHSGGIHVADEASWVGLGWDMTFGGIVQTVNGSDDLIVDQFMQPNYLFCPTPTYLPFRYAYGTSCGSCNGTGWSNPYPIPSVIPTYSYYVATNYYMPINGDFDDQADGESIATEAPGNTFDSDPDIFSASINGHNITFKLNFVTKNFDVLNDTGYAITYGAGNFEIVAPNGVQYYFQQFTTVHYTEATVTGISSKIWVLTKVITQHKKQILFNYTHLDSVSNFPSFTQKWASETVTPTLQGANACNFRSQDALFNPPVLSAGTTFTFTAEDRLYMSSIQFPNGTVYFYTSSRSDLLGGLKLDSVQIASSSVINTYHFNYAYFNSAGVGGSIVQSQDSSIFGNMPNLRLQLASVKDNSGQVYSFTYNPVPLPAKNSQAQDFWGFYNGQLNNTSTIPNPARLNNPSWGNNGNNNSASSYYAQACMLTTIQYPTGGTDSLEYALNDFTNYWMPDSATLTNTISHGDGLRIQAIDYRATGSVNAKRTIFTYINGVNNIPFECFRTYDPPVYQLTQDQGSILGVSVYTINEIDAKGFFSANPLCSINGVGYKEVIQQDIAPDGTTNGRVETYFDDTMDNISNAGIVACLTNVSLPPTKVSSSPENGSVDHILYYDSNNNLVKAIHNSYYNVVSSVYYGVRVFGYGAFLWGQCPGDVTSSTWTPIPQTLIAFYPVFDMKTLLSSRTTTEYASGDSMTTVESYAYDALNQPYNYLKGNGEYYIQSSYEYPYTTGGSYTDAQSQSFLMNDHRLSELVYETTSRGRFYDGYAPGDYAIKHYEVNANQAVVESSLSQYHNLLVAIPIADSISYDMYDNTYANLLQFTKNYTTNSLIWGYNGEYVIAEIKNASQSNVAYTSFEGSSNGNWTYAGIPNADATAPTGYACYSLAGGSVVSPSLSSATTYVVSYWIKSSRSLTIAGTISGYPLRGATVNGWTYFEHKVTGQTSVSVSGSGYIDELRLYPATAQMTTYAYTPLIGMTAQCDMDSRLSHYDYDAYGRLKDIRDQNGNIIKTYSYHYQGQ